MQLKKNIETLLSDYSADKCDIIMGDVNLNPRKDNEKDLLNVFSGKSRFLALHEPTTVNNNQLDHIFLNKDLKELAFVTSFTNFISDHRSIVIR